MKISLRHLVVPLVGLACLPAQVRADGVADYEFQVYQERFFDPLQSTQSMAMGGSMLTVTSDATSTVGNPAGLGWMKKADVALAYSRSYISGNDRNTFKGIEQNKNNGYALGSITLDPEVDGTPRYGSVGFGWAGSNVNGDANADGDAYQIALAYGIDIAPDWTIGYGVGYYNDDYSSNPLGKWEMTDGVRQTVGTQYQIDDTMRAGLMAFYGFGTQEISTGSGPGVDNDIDSFGIAAGLTHQVADQVRMAYGVDYTKYNGDKTDDVYSWAFRTGVEVPVYSNDYLLRAGYRYQGNFDYDGPTGEQNAKFNAVSFGAGLKLYKDLTVNYAAEYRHVGDGDWSHMVSLQYPFSLCTDA